ncbi:MAG: hypothetical protein ILNGONEN_02483 [Syntrophorhabdaceae bacterium]|nr:hypothetical protein [Syntrophorhabdaceae bacterium]MDI9562503.1 hypothetical protein [Pseudomonadota bacterium]HNQ64115.1 hypothetical protein [Syntrophorhabdaceae bacterium]
MNNKKPEKIDRIHYIDAKTGNWVSRDVPPACIRMLSWATDVTDSKGCGNCRLSFCCHPMVQDDKNAYHKLCTKTVIRAGLIKSEDVVVNYMEENSDRGKNEKNSV